MPGFPPSWASISSRLQDRQKKPLRQKDLSVLLQAGLIHHRHHPDPPLPLLLCNNEAKAESISLANWHVAC